MTHSIATAIIEDQRVVGPPVPAGRPRLILPVREARQPFPVSRPEPGSGPCCHPVGRALELAVLRRTLDDARARRGASLVMHGGWGVGKSTLLATLAQVAGPDLRVLSTAGAQTEAGMPFAGLHHLLRPLFAELRFLPVPQARALDRVFGLGEHPAGRLHAALGTLTLLTRAGRANGVLVLVDDAHWLDQASREVLTFVARRLKGTRTAMIFAADEDTTPRFTVPGVPDLQVGALHPNAARALLDRHIPDVPDAVAHRLLNEAAGNPAALLDLLSVLDPDILRGEVAVPEPLPCGARTRDVVGRRVHALPATTRRLLLIAAANDRTDLDPVLAAARHLGVTPAAATPAERAGLLQVTQGQYDFPAPVVRSAVYQEAATAERHAAHRALADVLAADPYRHAWHLAAAAQAPDNSLALTLADAATRTRTRSLPEVSDALERAAYLASDPGATAHCLVDAAAAAWWAGLRERTESLLRRVPTGGTDGRLRAKLARLSGAMCQATSSDTLAHRVLVRGAHESVGTEPELAGELLAMAGQAMWATGDTAPLATVGQDIDRLRLPGQHPLQEIGRRYQGLGAGDLRAAGDENPSQPAIGFTDDHEPWLWCSAAVIPYLLAEPDSEAREAHATRLAGLRGRDATGALPAVLARLATMRYAAGLWADAVADATEGLVLAERTGQRSVAGQLRALLAMTEAVRGEPARCRELVESAFEFAIPNRVTAVTAIGQWALGLAALGAGDFQAAVREYEEIVDPDRSTYHSLVALLVTPDLVEAYTRLGLLAEASQVLDNASRWTVDSTTPGLHCGILRARGLLATAEAERDRCFQAALAVRTVSPFDLARTELCYGELLRRDRRIQDARRHLHAALTAFTPLAAAPWLARTRAELRAAGDGHGTSRTVPSLPLTAQEARIARLAAKGMTNKEIGAQMFLTPRTVRYHLYKAFPKLGITSRHQLRDLDLGVES
ncbi:MAG TPA: AAA family ATPase [Micromonosporaceae bacterium]